MEQNKIVIKGAKENNLKNIDLEIPRNQLVIMTGLSGSGKTSLAFDTIYAEGQRRYVESLSAYARQFLGGVEKPDVELIEGLSPSISIDQKTTSNNPRSTVGTVTEIYDYLRLLYARVGIPYCPTHNEPITSQTIQQMVERVMQLPDKTRLEILAPVVKEQKGTQKDLFAKLQKDGYVRVRVDGEVKLLEDEIVLEKNKKHTVEIVVDRIVKSSDSKSRLHDSLENALRQSDGTVIVKTPEEELLFSSNYACKICGFSVPHLEPRLFSFNAPLGACPTCNGLGVTQEVDVDYLIPDRSKSIRKGGIVYYKNIVDSTNIEWQTFAILCKTYGIDLDKPIEKLTKKQIEMILYGSDQPIEYSITSSSGNKFSRNDYIEGVKTLIERRYVETTSSMSKEWYQTFMMESTCPTCKGRRLNEMALCVRVGDKNIVEFTEMSVRVALEWV
ncbi:MAG: excinuclease ABC subunit UvrA, partial [Anaerorhabdus sp.]